MIKTTGPLDQKASDGSLNFHVKAQMPYMSQGQKQCKYERQQSATNPTVPHEENLDLLPVKDCWKTDKKKNILKIQYSILLLDPCEEAVVRAMRPPARMGARTGGRDKGEPNNFIQS